MTDSRMAYERWERETFGDRDDVHRDRARFTFERAEATHFAKEEVRLFWMRRDADAQAARQLPFPGMTLLPVRT